jgi:hypothetical protein
MENRLSEIDVHCLHLWRSMIQDAIKEQDKVLAQCLRLASDEVAPTLLGDMIHHSVEESFRGECSLIAWLGMINETLTTQDIRMARTLRIMSDEIYPGLIEPIPPTHLVSASDLSSLISPSLITSPTTKDNESSHSYVSMGGFPGSAFFLLVLPSLMTSSLTDASVTQIRIFPDDMICHVSPTPEPEPDPPSVPDPTDSLRLDDADAVMEHLRVFQISDEEMEISRLVLNGEIDVSTGMDLVMQMFSTRVPRYSSEGGLVVDIKPPQ